ncbi:MAG: methylated-DNA--[protein]-cysteine S-methyltransferase [Clostridium sp.]|uniref:MGMT family protein n=1 Tax=Clostridium sp. TaxID=1506 RepID=UPI0029106E22|nr:methylated-DNA--[protein]-cysteine S-methyltransferase [Clostridium sp.]MDU7336894.1 methylated-DNA--[protein]-cysteine S-methyltransferase [Clostridium sp.]
MGQRAFSEQVYEWVAKIPYGKVVTYGQIAFYIGKPRSARQVGYVLSHTPSFLSLPCHRVVNRLGATAPGWQEQRSLLQAEGVSFRENGTVNLACSIWRPTKDEK